MILEGIQIGRDASSASPLKRLVLVQANLHTQQQVMADKYLRHESVLRSDDFDRRRILNVLM